MKIYIYKYGNGDVFFRWKKFEQSLSSSFAGEYEMDVKPEKKIVSKDLPVDIRGVDHAKFISTYIPSNALNAKIVYEVEE